MMSLAERTEVLLQAGALMNTLRSLQAGLSPCHRSRLSPAGISRGASLGGYLVCRADQVQRTHDPRKINGCASQIGS